MDMEQLMKELRMSPVVTQLFSMGHVPGDIPVSQTEVCA